MTELLGLQIYCAFWISRIFRRREAMTDYMVASVSISLRN